MKDSAALPGPGQFQTGDDWSKIGKGAGFGSSKRGNLGYSKDTIPGPGNYQMTDKALAAAPAYSMGSKNLKKPKEWAPGPGAYNPSVSASKEGIGGVKIGTSKRGELAGSSENPGPGNYGNIGGLGGPTFGFGTGSRHDQKKDNTPGPGHYKVPCHVQNLPTYAMPDRNENFRYV